MICGMSGYLATSVFCDATASAGGCLRPVPLERYSHSRWRLSPALAQPACRRMPAVGLASAVSLTQPAPWAALGRAPVLIPDGGDAVPSGTSPERG
jgi:hypothetical protein